MDIKSILKFFKENEQKIIIIIGGALLAALSFGVGGIMFNKNEVDFVYEKGTDQNLCLNKEESPKNGVAGIKTDKETIPKQEEKILRNFVASKNSNKYHLPSCPGAKRIKEENKVWFQTKEEAEKAGYAPAKTCFK